MAVITLDRVKVVRDSSLVLDVEHLEVADGELLVVLGPSGAGKSMLLRAIAGLEPLSGGTLRFDGLDMAGVDTAHRGVAMLFQDNVLYPFLDVRGNIGFPLRVRHTSAEETATRVEAEARALEIEHLLARMPSQLSAGHQQLVQTARAMTRVPQVFLMDEPLARLDAHRREEMRQDLRLLQQGYGVTTVLVTNDHDEAMVMADRIAAIDRGAIRQVGPPRDLYRCPQDRFVAELMGPISFVRAQVVADGAGFWLRFGGFSLRAWAPALAPYETVDVGVRPEEVIPDSGGVEVEVGRGRFVGDHGAARVALVPGEWVEMRTDGPPPAPGDRVRVRLRRLFVLDPSTGVVVAGIEDGGG